MQSIRQLKRLNDIELEKCTPPNASWHTDYRDTAYIYIGGLPFELSEGDVLAIFSQYGNPAHINLVRDQDTGKSRGFCFLKYEDQRSCDLAVDNLSGASVMGRMLSVDHTRYKKKEGEVEGVGDVDEDEGDVTEREDKPQKRKRIRSGSEEKSAPRRLLKEEIELQKLLEDHDEGDPMKTYLVDQKKEEVKEAKKRVSERTETDSSRPHRHHRHHAHRSDHDRKDYDGDHHRSKRRPDGSATAQTRDGATRESQRYDHSDGKSRRERKNHRRRSSSSEESRIKGTTRREDHSPRSRRDNSRTRRRSKDRDRERYDR